MSIALELPRLWLPPVIDWREKLRSFQGLLRPSNFVGVFPVNTGATLTLIQDSDTGASPIVSGSPGTIFSGNTTAGHAVLLCIASTSVTQGDVASVTSSIGTMTKLLAYSAGGTIGDIEIWYIASATGAAKTVTVTTTSGSNWRCQATEWSASAPITVTSGGTNTATNTAPTQSVNPLATGNEVVVFTRTAGTINAWPGAPWTFYDAGLFTTALSVAWAAAPSPASLGPTWGLSGSALWTTIAAVLS